MTFIVFSYKGIQHHLDLDTVGTHDEVMSLLAANVATSKHFHLEDPLAPGTAILCDPSQPLASYKIVDDKSTPQRLQTTTEASHFSTPSSSPSLRPLLASTDSFFALVVTLYPPNSVSTDDFKSDPSSESYSTKFSHVSAPTRPPNRPLRTNTEAMHRMGRPVMSKPNPLRLQAKRSVTNHSGRL